MLKEDTVNPRIKLLENKLECELIYWIKYPAIKMLCEKIRQKIRNTR